MNAPARTTRGVTSLVRRAPRRAYVAPLAILAVVLACGLPAAAQGLAEDPEGKVVADVIPKLPPNHITETQKVMTLISTRPGMKYSKARIDQDVRKLFETNSFVDVRAQPVLTPEGKVVVYFDFSELPNSVQDIIYKGAKHIKPSDLDSLTGLRKGMPMNPAANKLACQQILNRYHEKGRLLAQVFLEEGDKRSDTRVVFNISEGPIARVGSIQFTGHHFVSGARLETQIKSTRQWLRLVGGQYNDAVVENDVLTLRDYYRSFGFHDVVVSRELQWEGDLRHVRLIFHIREGQQYHIANVEPQGNAIMKNEEIMRFVKLRPGDVYKQEIVTADLKNIGDLYGYRGYGVSPREEVFYPQERPGEVDIRYSIEERPPARMGEPIVIGNTVTRQNVILRQLPPALAPGQPLSYPDMRLAEQNLAKLGIFEFKPDQGIRPTVTADENTDSDFKNIIINVQETQTGSLMFGVGANSNAGLTGSIVLNERNFDIMRPPTSVDDLLSGRAFRGAGQEFRIEAMPGTVFQRYTASFREPFLFDSPYSLGLSAYYYTRIFNEYTEQRVGSQLSIGRQLTPLWSASTGIRLENVGVHNVPDFAPGDFQEVVDKQNVLVGLRAGAKRDSRDSYLRPTEGSVVNFAFEEVLGDFTFPVASIDGSKYWTTYQRPDGSGRHVLAYRGQLAVNGTHAPVFERQYAGGFTTIRGFQFRGVGPNDDGFMVGGNFMLLNSLEYQIPLRANDQIYLVGFIDSGTVERNVEITNYRVSAGLGVRLVVPMLGPMPIALDFAFPLNRTGTDREQVFNFWVGYFH
jgi:outer membrane protein insertion porin family